MATPILNQASKDLASKLQDPVSDGTSDGSRYTADDRLGYIIRAYRRMLRLVTLTYPGLITKLFQNYFQTGTATTASDGTVAYTGYAEIYDSMYCKQPGEETYDKATWIQPSDFLDVKMGYNDLYTPDINSSNYYWSLLNSKISLLPTVTYNITFLGRADIARDIETSGYDGATDLDIPRECLDILLSLAAAEGYMDLGQPDMIQTYEADATNQLNILNLLKQEKRMEDATSENI